MTLALPFLWVDGDDPDGIVPQVQANFELLSLQFPIGPSQLANSTPVTALPTSPVGGQQVDLVVDTAGTYGGPYLWRCKYRAETAAPYRWHVTGGEALWAYIGTTQNRTLNTYGDLATVGPSITVPFAGIYVPRLSMEVFTNAAAAFGCSDIQIGATVADGTERLLFQQVAAGGQSNAAGREQFPVTIAAAATVVKMMYQADGVNAAAFTGRTLALRPVRIG